MTGYGEADQIQELEQRLATLEAQLAEVTKERDILSRLDHNRARANELLIAERDALKRHYDAAGPEHNLLALLDLYDQRRRDAEQDADTLKEDLVAVAEAAQTIVASFYGKVGIAYGSEIRALRDALARPGVQAVLRPETQQPC